MKKKFICVIIPAYNEEKVIGASLRALKKIIPKKDIYVVSDGSSDNTVPLAYGASVNVLALAENFGKAKAISYLIKSCDLAIRYEYILFSDADSHLAKDFIKQVMPFVKSNPACIVGTVTSDRRGLISAFRTYEYGMTHLIFKNAQNAMKTITVAPGCGSLYRSDVLKKLNFNNRTLTEDFDLTLQIHKKKLGQIIYTPKAKIITQDPPTIKDYWHQVLRWYTGFWQNILLHKLYKPTKKINLEIYLLSLDIFAGLGASIYFIFHPELLLRIFITMFIMMIVLSSLIVALQKQFWAIIYAPLFPILYFVNLIAYASGFFRTIFSKKRSLAWKKVTRYETTQEIRKINSIAGIFNLKFLKNKIKSQMKALRIIVSLVVSKIEKEGRS